jgi:integrase
MENEKIIINNSQIPVSEVLIKREAKVGRPSKLTVEDVLKYVAKYQTTSPYELAKLLEQREGIEVSHMTIYRLLKQIPPEQINATLQQLAEEQLKPYEMEREVFVNLPEVQEFIKTLKAQKLAKRYLEAQVRSLWHFCVKFNIRPKALTIEKLPWVRDRIQEIEEGKVKIIKPTCIIKGLRLWYLYYVGISKEKLNKYIGSISPIVGMYAREKIPMDKREAFIEELKKYCMENGIMDKYPIYLSLVYWLFYTGTRITASLDVNIQDIKELEGYSVCKVVDKGRHKLGREKWDKIIIHNEDLEKAIKYNLESRGNPKEGKLFPLSYNDVRTTFRTIFQRLGLKYKQPNHIWRHTAAQELLDATGWNYDLVASILGWKDTRTLKACYGEMGDFVRVNTLMIAMGLKPKEEPKPFKFSNKPIENFFLPSSL